MMQFTMRVGTKDLLVLYITGKLGLVGSADHMSRGKWVKQHSHTMSKP